MTTKNLFHKLATQGKTITRLRRLHEKNGKYFSSHRIEMMILFKRLKKLFTSNQNA